MHRYLKPVFVVVASILVLSCARPQGTTKEEKIDFIQKMRSDALAQLYVKQPQAKEMIRRAAGYGVFSNVNTQFLFFGTGQGYGVVVDNSTDKDTYMKMAQAGVGFGVALKDFREIIIFNNRRVLYDFINKGWDFGVQGDVAMKSGEKGKAASGAASFERDIVIYQITEAGVALRTNVAGKKYWRNDELNY